jgi:hypothetical protein
MAQIYVFTILSFQQFYASIILPQLIEPRKKHVADARQSALRAWRKSTFLQMASLTRYT